MRFRLSELQDIVRFPNRRLAQFLSRFLQDFRATSDQHDSCPGLNETTRDS